MDRNAVTLSDSKSSQNTHAKIEREELGINDLIPNTVFRHSVIRLAGGQSLHIGEIPLIMGILNVTPDSFSDGGLYADPQAAVEHALQMAEQGADIIDIGGFSTRPGAANVEAEEEMRRILPVIRSLRRQYAGPISVDTFRAVVAEAAVGEGADIINDVGGLKTDRQMAATAARLRSPVVVMHSRMDRNYNDLVTDMIEELRDSLAAAETAGLPREQIVIDPGIGFGKTPAQNLTVLKNLHRFHVLGLPILVGASRKSFIGQVLDQEPADRMEGSLAVAVWSLIHGAAVLRVHDVLETRRVLDMTWAMMRA